MTYLRRIVVGLVISFVTIPGSAFSVVPSLPPQVGGRLSASTTDDNSISSSSHDTISPDPPTATEARLIVLQITDVYTLNELASFKTLLEDTRNKYLGAKVVSVLTGDFLAPYLLSAVDNGKGMMNALNSIPLDYITWGNHEADIAHKVVCRHVKNFKGIWLNSNMIDHEVMDAQQEYDVICLESPDGSNTRKVGLTAVLSDAPSLYSPGAFGGATVTDPWEALAKYQTKLQSEPHSCDFILPFEHLYEEDDHKTCREFDFPVVMSGHDHHRVDEVIEGTRLLKPGMNAEYATILEISWKDSNEETNPNICADFLKVGDWDPDPDLKEENERAYDILAPLRNTELAHVPSKFEPLSSQNARKSVCTMGMYLCTLLRSSLNMRHSNSVDAVFLKGSNVRGNAEYEEGSFFSLKALEAEFKGSEEIGITQMPGWLLAEGVAVTHVDGPNPGWVQFDDGVQEDTSVSPPQITHVAGEPLDKDRIYRVATKLSDLTSGRSPPWSKFYEENPDMLPAKEAYVNVHSELMSYFARNLWKKLWKAISSDFAGRGERGDSGATQLEILDADGDGEITVEEIQIALRDLLGYSIDENEVSLAEFVHSFADMTHDGHVTLKDLKLFAEEMETA